MKGETISEASTSPAPPSSGKQSQVQGQMNNPREEKPIVKTTAVQRLLDFEQKKGLSIRQKRQKIQEMNEYEKNRSKILQKKITKDKAVQGRFKCLKDGCLQSFPRLSLMHMHLAQEHKLLADQIGILLHECDLCKQYSALKQPLLDKHQVTCAKQQRAILVARGELEEEEEELNTEEELAYEKARKYN